MSRRSAIVAALLAAGVAHAAGADFALDPVHTRVVFAVSHAGFSRALGTISGSRGTLRFDRDDWRTAKLDVTVPVAQLDLGDPEWNASALASGLLDGKRHPSARFVSTQVEPVDADHARVCGDLTLRGTTGPVCLDVTLNALKRHPLPPFRRTVGFSATGALSRRAFGIDAWPSVIGDRIELIIEAEATAVAGLQKNHEERSDAAPSPPAPTPPSIEPPPDPTPIPENPT